VTFELNAKKAITLHTFTSPALSAVMAPSSMSWRLRRGREVLSNSILRDSFSL
jgi:hypothetical protein